MEQAEISQGFAMIRPNTSYVTNVYVLDTELAPYIRDTYALECFLAKEVNACRIRVLPYFQGDSYLIELSHWDQDNLARAAERLDVVLVQLRDAAYFLENYSKILKLD